MTGITSEVGSLGWVVSGVIVGATATAFITCPFTGVTCFIGLALVGGVTGAGAATVSDLINPEIGGIIVEGDGVDNNFLAPTIIEANSDKFKALNCEDILTLA